MKTLPLNLTTSIVLFLFTSCEKTDIQLNKTAFTLNIGETETLVATVLPDNEENMTVNWTSSNTAVATVDLHGQVTAKAVGTAIITASIVNKTAKCTVTVIEKAVSIEEPEMIFVEGGTFMFGCTDDECDSLNEFTFEQPAVEKTVKSFYIAKYPVTQKLWKEVMGDFPQGFTESNCGKGNNYPMCCINFIEVQEFILKLNQATGKEYGLPSSIEWEYAARGGNKSKGYKYSGSDNIDEVAWYKENSNGALHPVGQKKANELGIYDMSGNVEEWVGNLWAPKPKSEMYQKRNGSWNSTKFNCRVSAYSATITYFRSTQWGFRLVLPAQEP